MPVSDYSTVASNNNMAPPVGAPEGVQPGHINDILRRLMANVRLFYDNTALVDGANGNTAALVTSGSYTGTFTGFAGSLTRTVTYRRCGNLVALSVAAGTGTSNATTFTVTGMPAEIIPGFFSGQIPVMGLFDNGANIDFASATINNSTGEITFYKNLSLSGWTNSGVKGVNFACVIVYPL